MSELSTPTAKSVWHESCFLEASGKPLRGIFLSLEVGCEQQITTTKAGEICKCCHSSCINQQGQIIIRCVMSNRREKREGCRTDFVCRIVLVVKKTMCNIACLGTRSPGVHDRGNQDDGQRSRKVFLVKLTLLTICWLSMLIHWSCVFFFTGGKLQRLLLRSQTRPNMSLFWSIALVNGQHLDVPISASMNWIAAAR